MNGWAEYCHEKDMDEMRALRRSLLDAYTLLPPERIHLLRPETQEQVKESNEWDADGSLAD